MSRETGGHESVVGSAPVATARKDEAELREDAETILRAAIEAVDPERLTAEALRRHADAIKASRNVYLVGCGKAAGAMARGAVSVLGERLTAGVIVVPFGTEHEAPDSIDVFGAGHPLPDQAGVAGSCALRALAREAEADDLVICLLSGGGSALMTLPPEELTLEDVQSVTELMLAAGATIDELNAVRKRIDQLKGGRLAQEAAPARVLALSLSDVVGDAPDVVASGPVSPDMSTFADAVEAMKRRGVWGEIPLALRGYMDRGLSDDHDDTPPPGDPCFTQVAYEFVGTAATAAEAACREAEHLGYQAQVLTTALDGEAAEAGRFLAATALALGEGAGGPVCAVAAGETVVTVHGIGTGGRNQELALAAAIELDGVDRALVASMGTDGVDGPTAAAGAVVTGTTVRRARELGLHPEQALARNDSHPFFEGLGDLIVSGPTGTNVGDVQVVLIG